MFKITQAILELETFFLNELFVDASGHQSPPQNTTESDKMSTSDLMLSEDESETVASTSTTFKKPSRHHHHSRLNSDSSKTKSAVSGSAKMDVDEHRHHKHHHHHHHHKSKTNPKLEPEVCIWCFLRYLNGRISSLLCFKVGNRRKEDGRGGRRDR